MKKIKYIITALLLSSVLSALEIGQNIENTAIATYQVHGVDKEVSSNTLKHTLEASDAEISFLYVAQNATEQNVLAASAYRDENGVLHESGTTTLVDGTVL